MRFRIIFILLTGMLLIKCDSDSKSNTNAKVEGLTFNQMKYPYTEKSFKFRGHNIVYVDSGIGQPLIFLHGQASDLLNFDPVYPLFVKNHRVIALDYPGFGKSDKPGTSFSEEFLVSLLDSLYETTGVESATLIGHSYGGYVGMLYGAARPERVKSMVLISPAGIQKFNSFISTAMRKAFTVESILKTTTKKALKNYRNTSVNWSPAMEIYAMRRVALLTEGGEEYRRYAHAMVQAMELMLNTGVGDRIGMQNLPTLLIWGMDDPLIPLKVSNEALQLIPSATLKTINDCGHFPMLEHPQEFQQIIEVFLKDGT
ncbi:MAG: alpha/beta hydrolase [Candidatus Marinimicrobia bacterium]|nr:alpha/beta hydrolase [Candidatus Neomarinimicrobiota bacterium]